MAFRLWRAFNPTKNFVAQDVIISNFGLISKHKFVYITTAVNFVKVMTIKSKTLYLDFRESLNMVVFSHNQPRRLESLRRRYKTVNKH